MSRTAALWDMFIEDIDAEPFHDILDDDPLVVGPSGGPIVAGTPFLANELGDRNAFIIVEAAFGADLKGNPALWNWYDITPDVRQADGNRVVISPMGRSDESSQSSPAGCAFQLDNTTGNYTSNHPGSKWWPYVRRNTPIRVRLYVYGAMSLRYQGQVNGWVPSWDTSCRLAVVTVSASGKLRQLNQGKTPLKSAMARAAVAAGAIASWPLEDNKNATSAASGLPSGKPMKVITPKQITFGAADPPAGSAELAQLLSTNALVLSGAVPASTSTSWRVEHVVKFPSGSLAGTSYSCIYFYVGGTITFWVVTAADVAGGGLQLNWLAPSTQGGSTSALDIGDDTWHHIRVDGAQSGSDIVAKLYVDNVLLSTVTATGHTNGAPTTVNVNAAPSKSLGQINVWAPFASSVDTYQAFLGYNGENAITRITRLCAEEGVPIEILGISDTTVGPQGVATLVALLRECESTDDGLLFDGRGPGLGYVTRQYRYNRPASLSLDMAADPPQVANPFDPVDNDQRNRNIIKVDQKNGSSATYEDSTSLLGSGNIGDYDASVSVNYGNETGLLYRAAHEVKKGTVIGFRYPTLNLDIAATPAQARLWLATPLAGRIDVLNVASKATQHPPGTVSLLLEGYGEALSPTGWDVGGNCSPFEPWRVAVIESSVAEYTWRLDSGGSTLHQDYPVGTTTILVDVSDGYPWSGTASDWPRDLDIGGVQVTATAAPTGVTQQTFAIAATAYPLAGGSSVKLWRPLRLAL